MNQTYSTYGQWYSISYYNERDHNISFKNEVPEIAVFFDVHPSKKKILQDDPSFEEIVSRLIQRGFESNLHVKISSNPWRLLYYRKPISEFEQLNVHQLMLFVDEVFGKVLDAGCMEHGYFREVSRDSVL